MNFKLLPQHVSNPVGGRTLLFAPNWAKLTQDTWVLDTISGYQLPLCKWPQSHYAVFSPKPDQVSILQTETEKLIGKGVASIVPRSWILVSSPFFVVPKNGGGYRPILDLRYLNTYLEAPHFKMEGLHLLPTVVRQDWVLGKVDLKDAYLTIPVAQRFHRLLAFQVEPNKWVQFQCLPFGLCTAPFVFSKVTKPVVQFLRQQGVHLILYLVDLLIAAPMEQCFDSICPQRCGFWWPWAL